MLPEGRANWPVQDAAGLPDVDPRDGAAVPSVPAPTSSLLGSYALHVRFYERELSRGLIANQHEQIAIARITATADGLQMQVQVCQDRGYVTTGGLRSDVRARTPSGLPVRIYGLVVEGDSFHTVGEPLAIGYTAQWPSECTAGARIPSSNPWLDGSCSCVAGDDPPTTKDDCRVTDPDRDGAPAQTFVTSGAVSAVKSLCIRNRSQYLSGVIDVRAKKHRANYLNAEDLREIACSAYVGCGLTEFRECALGAQLATFEPLPDANPSCADVMKRVESNQLFVGEGLDDSFPSGC